MRVIVNELYLYIPTCTFNPHEFECLLHGSTEMDKGWHSEFFYMWFFFCCCPNEIFSLKRRRKICCEQWVDLIWVFFYVSFFLNFYEEHELSFKPGKVLLVYGFRIRKIKYTLRKLFTNSLLKVCYYKYFKLFFF